MDKKALRNELIEAAKIIINKPYFSARKEDKLRSDFIKEVAYELVRYRVYREELSKEVNSCLLDFGSKYNALREKVTAITETIGTLENLDEKKYGRLINKLTRQRETLKIKGTYMFDGMCGVVEQALGELEGNKEAQQ